MTPAFLALFFAASARAAAVTPPEAFPEESETAAEESPPYDLKALPPVKGDLALLAAAGYDLREDGSLWAPGAARAVNKSEFPFVLQKLQGAQRLKSLIAIEMIYRRSDGGAALEPGDREALRKTVRENWRLFSVKTRRDFKKFFSPGEIAEFQAASSPAPAPAHAPAPQKPASEPVLAEELLPSSALARAAPSPALPAGGDVPVHDLGSGTAPMAAQEILPAVLQPLGVAKAAAAPAPPIEIPPALPLAPGWETPEGFEAFLKGAPYSDETKALLRLISQRAPEFARARALKLTASRLPEISMDPARLGTALRGRVEFPPGAVILAPGPIFHTRKSFFRGDEDFLIGEAPQAYRPLHLNAPPQALDRELMPKRREKTAWGDLEYFEDGSARGTYSAPQRAGVLLHELLILGGLLEDPAASPYLMESLARTAQLMFYALLRAPNDGDAFLDPEERAALREWLAHPQEARDHFARAFFSRKPAPLDEEALAAAGRSSEANRELLRQERRIRQDTPLEQK